MTTPGDQGGSRPPLFVVKGDASEEEVAALTVVLQALASGSTRPSGREPRPEWSAPHRLMGRATAATGPGAWRSSSLPR